MRGLQTGSEAVHENQFRNVPPEAINADVTSRYYAHPWLLETLANEYLVSNADRRLDRGATDPSKLSWDYLAELVNSLKNLEEAETAIFGALDDVLREIVRIKYRQFHWQSGLVVFSSLYRSHYLLNAPEIHANFEKEMGVSLDLFVRCSFGLWALSMSRPSNYLTASLERIGVTLDDKRKVISKIGYDWQSATNEASRIRDEDGEVAYKPSLLRERPVLLLPGPPTQVFVPMVELLFNRFTGNLFYDCVVGSDECQNIYAERFEAYCLKLLCASLDDSDWSGEIHYGTKNRPQLTPDILGIKDGDAALIVECKAKRVPFRFKADIRAQEKLGEFISELAYGQYQIWKFAHDVRTGKFKKPELFNSVSNGAGLVVTFEDWSTTLRDFRETINDMANQKAIDKGVELIDADRIPTCFVCVETLERLTSCADTDSLVESIKRYSKDFEGWDLQHVWRRLNPDNKTDRPYAFIDDLQEVLPWFDNL